ncbi:hypothetical protein [Acetobacter fabarum]|uniref:Uncharacterized protein n=1 Tax=Acetobacter fabarum TaxID=483199 RepID=A0A269XX59_9PROT|nr:hypothetical protein [Acetobacter fabarum]PAK77845.1 hypothetical protein B8X00_09205 [Acetobacter fabarum]PEN28200.1 hypothetical protein CRM93_04010 [Acetobacter fabarum]
MSTAETIEGIAGASGAILGVVGEVVELAEKYGPEIYTTVVAAIEQSKSGTGPTDADIQAIIAKCVADNAAIQSA